MSQLLVQENLKYKHKTQQSSHVDNLDSHTDYAHEDGKLSSESAEQATQGSPTETGDEQSDYAHEDGKMPSENAELPTHDSPTEARDEQADAPVNRFNNIKTFDYKRVGLQNTDNDTDILSVTSTPCPTVESFPLELQIHILVFLTVQDLLKCLRVCKRWNNIISSCPLLWRQHFWTLGASTNMLHNRSTSEPLKWIKQLSMIRNSCIKTTFDTHLNLQCIAINGDTAMACDCQHIYIANLSNLMNILKMHEIYTDSHIKGQISLPADELLVYGNNKELTIYNRHPFTKRVTYHHGCVTIEWIGYADNLGVLISTHEGVINLWHTREPFGKVICNVLTDLNTIGIHKDFFLQCMSGQKIDDGYVFVALASDNKHVIIIKMQKTNRTEAGVCFSVYYIELYEGYDEWYESCAVSLNTTNLIVTTPFGNALHLRIFNIAPLVNSTNCQNIATHLHSSKILLKNLEKLNDAFWVMDHPIFSMDILSAGDRYMLMNIGECTKTKGPEFLILIPLYDNGRVIEIDDNKRYWWTETAAIHQQYLTEILNGFDNVVSGKMFAYKFHRQRIIGIGFQ